eukprot:TRINITY_DN9749_c0_g2_i1.p1 TRINITY_DN9749_c0_g2~~TRINITY_DN9749_c0_g2_i1.p1  ORF type:complete len:791 (+),score=300.82 TRINITY_DN9749_c0_g2_i1:79-2451(+)
MDDELRALRQRLRDAQRVGVQKQSLNERDCVEVLQYLLGKGALDAVYTCDGKEFVTAAHLETEVAAELEGRGGRIALAELASALNVPLAPHVENAVQRVIEKEAARQARGGGAGAEPRYLLHHGEMLSSAYLSNILREAAVLLAHRGRLQLADVAARFKLDRAFLTARLLCDMEDAASPLHGTSIEDGVLYSPQYIQRQTRRLRGALRGATAPVHLPEFVAALAGDGASRHVMFNAAEGVVAALGGVLHGGARGTWTPRVYEVQRQDAVHTVYAANGWVKLASVRQWQVTQPAAWLEHVYNPRPAPATQPDEKAPGRAKKGGGKKRDTAVATPLDAAAPAPHGGKYTGVVLDTLFVQATVFRVAAEEAAARFGAGRVWADLGGLLPQEATDGDVRLALEHVQAAAGRAAPDVAGAAVVARCVLVDTAAVLREAEAAVQADIPKHVAAAFQAADAAVSGKGAARAPPPSAAQVLDRHKPALLDALVACLARHPTQDGCRKPDFSAMALDMHSQLAARLLKGYEAEASLAARARAAAGGGGVSAIRSRDDAERAVRASWTLLLLEGCGVKAAAKAVEKATGAVLGAHVLRTTGLSLLADIANIILLANGDAPKPVPPTADDGAGAENVLTADGVRGWVSELPALHKDPLLALCDVWAAAVGDGDVEGFTARCEAARDALGVSLRAAKGPRELKDMRKAVLAAPSGRVQAALACATTATAAALAFSLPRPKMLLHSAPPPAVPGLLAALVADDGDAGVIAGLRAAAVAEEEGRGEDAQQALAAVRAQLLQTVG